MLEIDSYTARRAVLLADYLRAKAALIAINYEVGLATEEEATEARAKAETAMREAARWEAARWEAAVVAEAEAARAALMADLAR